MAFGCRNTGLAQIFSVDKRQALFGFSERCIYMIFNCFEIHEIIGFTWTVNACRP